MEISFAGIYLKNYFMKKVLAVAASLILVVVSANSQSEKKESPPPPPKPKEEVKVPPMIIVSGINEFYTRNTTVSEISRRENIITLKMKDGTTEKYDMSKKDEDKTFTEKYGVSPIPPPPPPPKVIKTKSKA